jgi:hypothetical protein
MQAPPIDKACRAARRREVVFTICESRTVAAVEAQLFPVWLIYSILADLAAQAAQGIAAVATSKPDAARGAGTKGRSRAQRAMLAAAIVVGTLLSFCGPVMAQTNAEKQARCELSAIRDTRSPVAVQLIRSACNWLALNGDTLLNAGGKNYRICLVQQLSGVQADQAAAVIVSACRTSYPPGF